MLKHITCIVCPMGCSLHVSLTETGYVIKGYQCKKGLMYANQELTAPKRDLSSIMKVRNRINTYVPIRTSETVDKSLIEQVMQAINRTSVDAPIDYHSTLIQNVLGLGIDVIATKAIK